MLYLGLCLLEWMFCVQIVSASVTANYGRYNFTVITETDSSNDPASLTQIEARSACINDGSTLVEIYNSDIQTNLTEFINDYAIHLLNLNTYYFITNGIRITSFYNNWMWLNGKAYYDGEGKSITQNGYNKWNYNYGYLSLSYPTYNEILVTAERPTDNQMGYICQLELSSCTNGTGVSYNGSCFYRFSSSLSLSWFDARNECLDIGGDLASFDFVTSDSGWNVLNASVWLDSSKSYWIGLRREWWTWNSSDSDIKYSLWSSGSPAYEDASTNCLCLNNYYSQCQWIACDCGNPNPFVCISDQTRSTPSIGTSSEATTKSSSQTSSTVSSHNTSISSSGWIGIGVGSGLGLLVVIIIVVVAVVVIRKRGGCPRLKCPTGQPDVIVFQTTYNLHQSGEIDNHYANVISLKKNDPGTGSADENQVRRDIVYADLDFERSLSSDHYDYDNVREPAGNIQRMKTATLMAPV